MRLPEGRVLQILLKVKGAVQNADQVRGSVGSPPEIFEKLTIIRWVQF